MLTFNNIEVISFDADDTLWENENYFYEMADSYVAIMKKYAIPEKIRQNLYNFQIANLNYYGYGIKSYILSLIETSLNLSEYKITPKDIEEIINLGKKALTAPVIIMPNVECVLKSLFGKYKLILATKGDLLDQRRKLHKSKLEKYFHHIEIMTDKKEENYRHLLDRLDVKPENFLMVGNSVKSDILPVINIGAYAIHIPFHLTWEHEVADAGKYNAEKFIELKEIKEVLNFL